MTWALKSSYTAHETPEYRFDLDEYRDDDGKQMLFVHLAVTRSSPSTFREMRDVWSKFREVVTCPIYALGPDEDDKFANFVRLFGFKPLSDVICENGEQRRLFLNTKKEKNDGKHVNEDGKHVFLD